MDLTDQKHIWLVEECFENWKVGKIWNQPIKYSVNDEDELSYYFGNHFFEDAFQKLNN